MSQSKVAQRAGIHRNHYQLLGSGLSDRARQTPSNPRLATLIAICEVYGTTVPELLADVFSGVEKAPGPVNEPTA